MTTLADLIKRINTSTSHIAIAHSYIDSIELFVDRRRDADAVRAFMIERYGPQPKFRKIKAPNGDIMGYRVPVKQPTRAMLEDLETLRAQYGGTLRRFDLAFDIVAKNSFTIEDIRLLVRHCFALHWRPKGPLYENEGTLNSVCQEGRIRLSNHDMSAYITLNRISGEDCYHVELRVQNTAACERDLYRTKAKMRNANSIQAMKREGPKRPEDYARVTDLFDINPREYFDYYFSIIAYDAELHEDFFVEKAIEHALREQRAVSEQTKDAIRERYGKRAASIWKRLQYYNVQCFKDYRPKTVERMNVFDNDIIQVPNCLDWGAVKRVGPIDINKESISHGVTSCVVTVVNEPEASEMNRKTTTRRVRINIPTPERRAKQYDLRYRDNLDENGEPDLSTIPYVYYNTDVLPKDADPKRAVLASSLKKPRVRLYDSYAISIDPDLTSKGHGIKTTIKNMIMDQPLISLDELCEELDDLGIKLSRMVVSNIRSEFRATLKYLESGGYLNGLSVRKG